MEIQARIEISVSDSELSRALYLALKPESERAPTERSISKIIKENNFIIINISTNDLTSLRASINSYFKWLKAIIESLGVIKNVWTRTK